MNGVVTATVWQHASELFFSMFRAVETLAVRSPIDSWSLCSESAGSGKVRAKTSSQQHHLACIVCKHNLFCSYCRMLGVSRSRQFEKHFSRYTVASARNQLWKASAASCFQD